MQSVSSGDGLEYSSGNLSPRNSVKELARQFINARKSIKADKPREVMGTKGVYAGLTKR